MIRGPGVYSFCVEKDDLGELPEFDVEDITAVETPRVSGLKKSKRSGEYRRAEFAQALEESKNEVRNQKTAR